MSDVIASAVLVLTVVALVIRQRLRAKALAAPGPGTDPTLYELAYLAGGPERMALTAASYLVWTGALEARESTGTVALAVRPERLGDDLRAVEIAIVNATSMIGTPAGRVLTAGTIAASESERGAFAVPRSVATMLVGLPVVVGGLAVGGLMVWAFTTGGSGVMVPVAFAVGLGLIILGLIDRPVATGAGRAALEEIRARLDVDIGIAAAGVTSLPIGSGMRFVAVYGRQVMNGDLAGLRTVMTR